MMFYRKTKKVKIKKSKFKKKFPESTGEVFFRKVWRARKITYDMEETPEKVSDYEVEKVLEVSNTAREHAGRVIDNLYAKIDKGGDRWFLVSKKTIDSKCKGIEDESKNHELS